MSLICSLGWHRPAAGARWNSGYYFTKCAWCGRDLVRGAYGGWREPRGYRVVWQPDEPEQPAADSASPAIEPATAAMPTPDADTAASQIERPAPPIVTRPPLVERRPEAETRQPAIVAAAPIEPGVEAAAAPAPAPETEASGVATVEAPASAPEPAAPAIAAPPSPPRRDLYTEWLIESATARTSPSDAAAATDKPYWDFMSDAEEDGRLLAYTPSPPPAAATAAISFSSPPPVPASLQPEAPPPRAPADQTAEQPCHASDHPQTPADTASRENAAPAESAPAPAPAEPEPSTSPATGESGNDSRAPEAAPKRRRTRSTAEM